MPEEINQAATTLNNEEEEEQNEKDDNEEDDNEVDNDQCVVINDKNKKTKKKISYSFLNGTNIAKDYRKITLHDLEQSEETFNTEYTYLHCVFLDIRAPQNTSSPFGTIQYYNNKSKAPGTKVPRILGGTHYYRRIYTFEDLDTQGLVFVVIDKTNDDENRHWREGKQNICIGDTLLVREPNNITNYISEGIPIIETMLPFKFLKKHARINKSIKVHKSITIQHFFMYQEVTAVQFNKATFAKSSCNNILCDRQRPYEENFNCGCFSIGTRNASSAYTIDFNLIFTPEESQSFQTMQHFRSNRTTLLFLTKPLPTSLNEDVFTADEPMKALRKAVKIITDIVNQNGGWDIIGWYKRGIITDHESDRKTSSEKLLLHIAYIMPHFHQLIQDTEEHKLNPDTMK